MIIHVESGFVVVLDADGGSNLSDGLLQDWTSSIDMDRFYDRCFALGLEYGATFKLVEKVHCKSNSIYAMIKSLEFLNKQFIFAPPILDAVFQSLLASQVGEETTQIPYSFESIEFDKICFNPSGSSSSFLCTALIHSKTESMTKFDCSLFTGDGKPLLVVKHGFCRAIRNPKESHTQKIEPQIFRNQFIDSFCRCNEVPLDLNTASCVYIGAQSNAVAYGKYSMNALHQFESVQHALAENVVTDIVLCEASALVTTFSALQSSNILKRFLNLIEWSSKVSKLLCIVLDVLDAPTDLQLFLISIIRSSYTINLEYPALQNMIINPSCAVITEITEELLRNVASHGIHRTKLLQHMSPISLVSATVISQYVRPTV